jgi:hypothetical protein
MEQVERIASVQSRDAHLMASRYFRNEPTLIRPKAIISDSLKRGMKDPMRVGNG